MAFIDDGATNGNLGGNLDGVHAGISVNVGYFGLDASVLDGVDQYVRERLSAVGFSLPQMRLHAAQKIASKNGTKTKRRVGKHVRATVDSTATSTVVINDRRALCVRCYAQLIVPELANDVDDVECPVCALTMGVGDAREFARELEAQRS